MKTNRALLRSTLIAVASIGTLSACSSSNDDSSLCEKAGKQALPSVADAPAFAFVSGAAPDFSAGRIERITVGETPALSGCTAGTLSDIRVATDGTAVYEIGRFGLDTLSKFDSETLATEYQYSLNGTDESANPHDVAFESDTRAYIARYGTSSIWIVDPAATVSTEFLLGEIDLSAYDADGATEMTKLQIVDGKLFVLMQRLQNFSPTLPGYLAVFDLSGETPVEIATGMGADGLNGVQLPVNNPGSLFYNEATNDLMIVATGDAFGTGEAETRLSGGVVAVDATDYSIEVLVDDNSVNTLPVESAEQTLEFFSDAIIVSADKGYVVSFTDFSTSNLRAFNPTTGIVETDPVTDFAGVNISALGAGPAGNVWVGVAVAVDAENEPGFYRVNPADDTVVGEKG